MNRMRHVCLAFLFGLCVSASAWAADNSTLPVSGGGTEVFANKDIAGVKFPKSIPYNSSGTELFTASNAGNVKAASGAFASGALASGSIASGAMVDLGAQADAACATDTGTCTAIALIKRLIQGQTTLNTNVTSAVPAGTNIVGKFGIDQTTDGTTNLVAAKQSGTWTVQPGNTANTTPWLVTPAAGTTGGSSQYHLVAANSTNSVSVKGSAGVVYSIQTGNIDASAIAYLKLYDKATAPTCNSDTVVKTIVIPANSLGGGNNVSIPVGAGFTSGIGICVTGGIADNDNTAVAASKILINIGYK